MLRRRGFLIAMTVALFFSLVTFLADVLPLYKSGVTGHLAAWSYWGPMDKGSYGVSMQLWEAMFIFLFPFLSTLAYSDCYYDDRQFGSIKSILARCRRSRYVISGAVVVFLGGFLMLFFPLLINQLLWLIAAPAHSISYAFSDGGIRFMMFPSVYAKLPYLNNFIYMIIPAATGGLIALSSFSLSLFYSKKRFAILTVPGIFYLFMCFIMALTGNQTLNLSNYMTPVSPVSDSQLWFLAASLAALAILNIVALLFKILISKDEL
jgi:hypothetical protein